MPLHRVLPLRSMAMSGAPERASTAIRVATAAVLLPVVLMTVWLGKQWLVASLVGLVSLFTLYEFFAIGERQGLRAYRVWTIVCSLAVVASQWSAGREQKFPLAGGAWLQTDTEWLTLELVVLAFALGLALSVVAGKRPMSEVLSSLGASTAALLLVAFPLSYLVRLHGMHDGRLWLLFTLALVWAGDTAAYFVGRTMGRLPMAPHLSPSKTWEGAVGNLFGSLLVAVAFSRWLDAGMPHLLLTAMLANIAGQIGDLAESAYKRGAGVKDSGTLLPGHGGMLDRIDALIFAAPVVWVCASFLP